MKSACFTFSFFLLAASPVFGADINITAEQKVEWHQKDQKMVAVGDAVATKEDMTVKADTLTGYYGKDAAGKGRVTRVTATGNVRMSSPKASAFGDNLDYDLQKEEAVLTGRPAKIDTGNEIITAEDKITYYPEQQKAVALGNVVAVDKDKNTLYSEKMIAYFAKEDPRSQNLTLRKVDIFDNIKIVTPDATVTADKGTYLPQTGLVKLFDNITINQEGNVLHGDKAETDLNTGISKLLSASPKNRVKGVFKEKK